ncbi:response regulator [Acidisoma sp. 7E03]
MDQKTTGEVAVVDDDAAVLESYRFMLELAGFRVATFSSALDYLAATAQLAPNCMILDQHMPMMTGLELAERLKGGAQDVPIMLVTAAPSPTILERAAELGITKVLEKPPSEDELVAFVESHR